MKDMGIIQGQTLILVTGILQRIFLYLLLELQWPETVES